MQLDNLVKYKLIMISGKGGTGKSLLAASLGLYFASMGKRVLVAQSSAKDELAPLFAGSDSIHTIIKVQSTSHLQDQDRLKHNNLFYANFIPHLCFEEYVSKHLGLIKLQEKIFRNNLVQTFLKALPGLSETMLLGRIFHACTIEEPAFDLVIFDGPSTGHFLSLMKTPDAVLSTGIPGPLMQEVQRVKDFLEDSSLATLLVACLPQKLVVSETIEFIQKLKEKTKLNIGGILLNRSYQLFPQEENLEKIRLIQALAPLMIELKLKANQTNESKDLLQTKTSLPIFSISDLAYISMPLTLATCLKLFKKAL